jgi:lysozyme family protein
MSFDTLIQPLLDREGGYSNDPDDSGGETNWGVTVAVARAFGYVGEMRDMKRDQAKAIYRARYWDSMLLDRVEALAPQVAEELFDTGVNLGVERAGEFLQRALNVLNRNGRMYHDTKVDGRIGQMTLAALREYVEQRGNEGVVVLLRALNALQGSFYIELTESREKDEKYVFGWLLNRVAIA